MDLPELDVILELGLPDGGSFDVLVERSASLVPTFKDVGRSDRVRRDRRSGTHPGLRRRSVSTVSMFWAKEGIPLQQFMDHFLNIHSQFGIGLPGRPGYRQLHRDETATTTRREVTGFTNEKIDGVAQLLFYGPVALEALGQQSPERLKATSEAGTLFIDADTRRTSIASVLLNAGQID